MKKTYLISSTILLIALFAPSQLPAQDENESVDLQHLAQLRETDAVDRAIQNGLAYLAKTQDAATGRFPGKHPNATTALACMAMMAAGEQDGRSQYGSKLRRGIRYLVEQADRTPPYLGSDGGRMYGHAIATLALCEAFGMMSKPDDNRAIRDALERLIPFIVSSQVTGDSPQAGGWRYHPSSTDADLSVTAWQILALRAAENCGFQIPRATVSNALQYVRSTYTEGRGFAYTSGKAPSPAMLAAGIVSMHMLGADEDDADRRMLEQSTMALLESDISTGKHFYYQSYYVATACNMLDREQPGSLLPQLQHTLLSLQTEDGQFAKHTGYDGEAYATALAVLALCARYQYLPIYQE